MSVKISKLLRHIKPGNGSSIPLRQALSAFENSCTLSRHDGSFKIMHQNMGLLPEPFPYKGTDRTGVISELIAQIRLHAPDIMGICEIFDNDERKQVADDLSDLYPHRREGPDRNSILDGRAAKDDGGLLLLSKHPVVDSASILFDDAVVPDWFSNKGILYMKVQPEGFPFPFTIFYTHMQDIEAPRGKEALYKQLSQAYRFINSKQAGNSVSIFFGDINIPAERTAHYGEMMQRLDNPIDIWIADCNGAYPGETFARYNNSFYADPDDIPNESLRLDYFLMKHGPEYIPVVDNMEVLRIQHNGRYISDHFGIQATFQEFVQTKYR